MTILRALVACVAFTASLAAAQPWPARPLTLVSPFPAGGITDLLSRIVGEELAKALGQPVVVENRLGAGGSIALSSVAKAAPDGYTLVMGGSAPSVLVPALNRNIAYGPKDFDAVAYVAGLPLVLVVHPSVPAANLKEFIAYARSSGDKLNCGHHGVGTGTHLACVQFARVIGAKIPDISYKGAAPVNADLLANRVQLYFGTLPTQIQYVRNGQMKVFGVATPERVASSPDIPTLDEQGLNGLNIDTWNGILVPAGTPRPIIQRLNAEIVKILAMPEVKKRVEATGSILRPGSAEQLQKMIAEDFGAYRKLAAEANIRVD